MAKLLAAAHWEFLPVLAIGAFAGLRTGETLALDWQHVRLAERVIKVAHRKARSAGTRLGVTEAKRAAQLSALSFMR